MTTLVRWNPTRNGHSLRRMQNDMDRLIESFFETPKVAQTNHWNLPLDVAETEDSYVISAAVAGLKPEEIDITVEEGVLSISGEVKNSYAVNSTEGESSEGAEVPVKFHLRERFYGSFNRKLRLPKDADSEAISATHEDGVLTINVSKSAAALPKKISIS